jgi:hypothetical protein
MKELDPTIKRTLTEHANEIVAGFISSPDATEIPRRMADHYRTLHLLQPDGRWVYPLPEDHEKQLLPVAVTESDCHEFIRNMLDCSLQNPFFEKFLEQAVTRRFPVLEHRLHTEGNTVLPDALAFAMVLERLTRRCYDDFRFLEECRTVIGQALHHTGAFKRSPLFYRIKLRSIDPVVYFLIRAHKRPPEKLGNGSGSRWLQVNILEAVFSDMLMGLSDNARAGWILARHKAGRRNEDPRTGAGSNYWSADRKAICLRHPFHKSWVDLYQIWNMAFVSKMDDLPYVITKLLIPGVSAYAGHPGAYMYSRIIALYLYMAFFCLDRNRRLNLNIPLLQWYDPSLTRFWGACAGEAATEYNALVYPSRVLSNQKRG